MTANETFARRYVAPHHDRIRAIFQKAWEHWMAIPEAQRGIIAARKRSFANALWAFVMHEAGIAFANTDVHVEERRGTVTFSVANQVLLRFKKVCNKGLSSNFPTQTAIDFNLQVEMDGMPEALRLDVGYLMDRLGMRIAEIRLIQREGNAIAWQYPILGEAGEAGNTFTDLGAPTGPTLDGAAETSRVRVTVPAKRAQEDGTAA